MYRNSQVNRFPNEDSARDKAAGYKMVSGGANRQNETVTPEVLDSSGRPLNSRARVSGNMLGLISVIIGVVAFILIFVGMFFHFVIALNIIFCLAALGFAIAALLKHDTVGKVFAVAGIAVGIFDLLVQLICMIIVLITSGISAIFSIFA